MRWPVDRIDQLAKLIAERIPQFVLREVNEQFGLQHDFDELAKEGPTNPMERYRYFVTQILSQSCGKVELVHFVSALYRRVWTDPPTAAALDDFLVEVGNRAKQASLVGRAAHMGDLKLSRFLVDTSVRICLVCASTPAGFERGTGFLVGPDLVLTSRHTLGAHIVGDDQAYPPPGPLFAIFDHFDGDTIEDPRAPDIKGRCVPFAQRWLVKMAPQLDGEGLYRDPPNRELLEQLPKCLDYALIRLADPIGVYTCDVRGGVRRLWFELPDDSIPANLRCEDRIILRQHPMGQALRVDFGRLLEHDESKTRIRYSANAHAGTSGAPCFDQNLSLVGMHVSAYKPDKTVAVANQAIRMDHIARQIRESIQESVEAIGVPTSTRVWDVAAPGVRSRRPILGRQPLLDWLDRATLGTPTRADRIYVANGIEARSGRSFTVDILRTAQQSEPVVYLGKSTEIIPSAAKDFFAVVFDQLCIPASELEHMPSRPDPEPAAMGDSQKLEWWASTEIPGWFQDVLRRYRYRTVNRTAAAQELLAIYSKHGRSPPFDVLREAGAKPPIIENVLRWPRIWIVFDGLIVEEDRPGMQLERRRGTVLSSDVSKVVAALCGGRADEASLSEEIRSIRWLFLGRLPPALQSSAVTVENLNPMAVGSEDIINCMRLFGATLHRPLLEDELEMLRLSLEVWASEEIIARQITQPSVRLELFQQYVSRLVEKVATRFKRRVS